MTNIINSLSAATVALTLPVMAMAQSVEGLWQTEPNEEGVAGYVQIGPCGDAYCGTMTGNSADTGRFTGASIIAGMKTTDGVFFEGGTITDPVKNKTYNSKMTLSGNSLKVEGCILTICRAQTWVRLK